MAPLTHPAPPASVVARVVNDDPVTADEYLRRERASLRDKHEFLDGWLINVTGASYPHNLIVANLIFELEGQLRGSGCRATANDLRVAVPALNRYVYPDVVVTCDGPDLEDDHLDTLRNPRVVVEVLSTSTEAYDRGDKFEGYRSIPTLREYVLVDQHAARVERFRRDDDGGWTLYPTTDADDVLRLESLDVELPLADIYLDVFPDDESDGG